MEQQTNTAAKASVKDVFKKHFNTPMLMVAIYCIANFSTIIRSVLNIVNVLTRNPLQLAGAVMSMAVNCFPLVLLLLLWRHRLEKLRKPALWIGSLSLVMAVLSAFARRGIFVRFFTALPENMYELISVSPFLIVLNYALIMIAYLLLGITLLRGKKGGFLFSLGHIAAIGVTLFFGILTQMTGDGSLVSAFITAMYFIALFNIPKVIQEPKAAELGKNRGLIALAVIVMVIYLISGSATGTLGGGGYDSYSTPSSNTCKSCGRSWNAGDSDGNFMNIAKTGMCNNCESNYHSLERYLD